MFLVNISIMTILTTLCSMVVFLHAYINVEVDDDTTLLTHTWRAILEIKIIFAFGSFTLLCAWSLVSLLLFHGMIISAAQTTNERVRGVYNTGSLENLADKGCWRNWFRAFCKPVAVSRLPRDMSNTVVCTYLNEETVWDEEEHAPEDPAVPPKEESGAPTIDVNNSQEDADAQEV